MNSSDIWEISTEECSRDNYKYFSVGYITGRYNGDLYAVVKYFNTLGKITGDEKIAVYRWRKNE